MKTFLLTIVLSLESRHNLIFYVSKPRQQSATMKKEWELETKVELPLSSSRLSMSLNCSEPVSSTVNIGNLSRLSKVAGGITFFFLVKC